MDLTEKIVLEALDAKNSGEINRSFELFLTAVTACVKLIQKFKSAEVDGDGKESVQELLQGLLELSKNCISQASLLHLDERFISGEIEADRSLECELNQKDKAPVEQDKLVTTTKHSFEISKISSSKRITTPRTNPYIPQSQLTVKQKVCEASLKEATEKFEELKSEEGAKGGQDRVNMLRKLMDDIQLFSDQKRGIDEELKKAKTFVSIFQFEPDILAKHLTAITLRLLKPLLSEGFNESVKCLMVEAALNDPSFKFEPMGDQFGFLCNTKRVSSLLLPVLDFYYFFKSLVCQIVLDDAENYGTLTPADLKEFLQKRSKTFTYLINLAEELMILRNYHLTAALISALKIQPVTRLKRTFWDLISKKDKKRFDGLCLIFDKKDDYVNYNKTILEQNPIVSKIAETKELIPDKNLQFVVKNFYEDYQIIAIPWFNLVLYQIKKSHDQYRSKEIPDGSVKISQLLEAYTNLSEPKVENIFKVLDSCIRKHMANVQQPPLDSATVQKLQSMIPKGFIGDLRSIAVTDVLCEHWILTRHFSDVSKTWKRSLMFEPAGKNEVEVHEVYSDYDVTGTGDDGHLTLPTNEINKSFEINISADEEDELLARFEALQNEIK